MKTASKPSEVYLEAWCAAEKVLPKASMDLISEHDRLHGSWRDAGWPSPIPAELQAAVKAVEADPFARIAFRLRQETNKAAHEEWRAEEAKKEAA